jgi:CRISPR/Cas system CSM-associated protein Csm3 (group 7 of RAMP superfamily)
LPYLPGKTLRGLLREGVQQAEESGLEEVPAGTTAHLFGKPPNTQKGGLHEREEGILRISDATLGADYETWAEQEEDAAVLEPLFSRLASTAIDSNGQVKEKTLRTMEVAVPLTLEALIHEIEEKAVEEKVVEENPADVVGWLTAGLKFIRGLGTQRRRGLGRVRFQLQEDTRCRP